MTPKEKLIAELEPMVKIQTIDDSAEIRAGRIADYILADREKLLEPLREANMKACTIAFTYKKSYQVLCEAIETVLSSKPDPNSSWKGIGDSR